MLKPQSNVTPLIDVLLVLLIIFMVISPVKPSSFKTRVPQEPKTDRILEPNPDTLVVTVDRESLLGINLESGFGSVNDPQKLVDKLRDVFDKRRISHAAEGSSNPPTSVFIKAPRGLDYGSVAKVVDAVSCRERTR